MATPTSSLASLEQLQSSKQIALLDAIDKLRSRGVNHYDISLPQLIVCGDQSSGKSAVLEGLTRLGFPMKDGLCTTFATEVVLRKGSELEISCSIIPGTERTEKQKNELIKFSRSYLTRNEFSFSALIDEAKKQMTFGAISNTAKFSDDTLRIKYTGPDVPSLTIVDLPGLIQSQIEDDKGESKAQVHQLVDRYMRQQNSIILAVVSARNDPENQAVFEKIKEVDPNGHRSLGIITKPDTLDAGSESETRFLRLAKNQIMPLELGWHVVKNRSFLERDFSDVARDEAERKFLASGVWALLARSDVGIDSLRTKLSDLLLRHICTELPAISAAIQDSLATTQSSLQALGNPRESIEEQRIFLTRNAEKFRELTRDALKGIYEDPFFAPSLPHEHNPTRLRTEIHNLNLAFSHIMYRKGHTWTIADENVAFNERLSSLSSHAIGRYDANSGEPCMMDRAEFLKGHIEHYVQASRPSGLLSVVNPWVIGEVFREQSKQWEAIAQYHLDEVFQAVKEYIYLVLESILDPRTANMLILEQVDPELERKRTALDSKLEELLQPYKSQDSITYDPSFFAELEEVRTRRYASAEIDRPQQRTTTFGQSGSSRQHLLTESIDSYANSDILDHMQTYYKKSLSVFISNVTVLAVESCLVSDIKDIFSSTLVSSMREERIRRIASESEEVQTERAALRQKLEDLRESKRVLDIQACNTRSALTNRLPTRGSLPTHRRGEPSRSRSHTPTPQSRARPVGADTLENMASGFGQLSVTPPHDQSQTLQTSASQSPFTPPKNQKTSRKISPRPSFASRAMMSDTEDEDNGMPSLGPSRVRPFAAGKFVLPSTVSARA